ncbi:MAG: protein kinase domain-containing protein [Myxococcaceae bacterium]
MSNGKDGKRPAADDDAAWAGYLDDETELDPARRGDRLAEADPHVPEMTLVELADKTLPTAERPPVLAHLDRCDRCRAAYSELVRAQPPPAAAGAPAGPIPDLDDGEDPTKVARPSKKLPSPKRDPLIGLKLGEYEVQSRISQGGMGIVYRGMQPIIGKPVAIKVLLPHAAEDPEQVHRLLGEARAVNAIRHPNIVDIYSFGELEDGRHYLVMELLDGEALSDLVERLRVIRPDQVMTVLDQALAGLDAAHSRGVIHRDIKPSNIFVTTLPDGSWRVKLLDFGVAKVKGAITATAPNIVLGTPGYMAPEQIRGEPVTPLTDLYALGAVGYLLLTGSPPFVANNVTELLEGHLDRAPAPPRSGAPAELDALVMQLLEKNPSQRPQSAAAARKLLERIRKQYTTNVGKPEPRRKSVPAVPVPDEREAPDTNTAPKPVSVEEPEPTTEPKGARAPSGTTGSLLAGGIPKRVLPKGPIPTWAIIAGAAVLVFIALLIIFSSGSSDPEREPHALPAPQKKELPR